MFLSVALISLINFVYFYLLVKKGEKEGGKASVERVWEYGAKEVSWRNP